MFQRFTSVLFGDCVDEGNGCPAELGFNEKEDDEEWILVDYLAEACTNETAGMCSRDVQPADRPTLCSSCSSLDSAAEDHEDVGFLPLRPCPLEESWFVTPPPCFTARGQAPVLLEESWFVTPPPCFAASGQTPVLLEESWFITPPPCFTASGQAPVLLQASPLENLLIEHPSMSVYAVQGPRHAQRTEAPRKSSLHGGCFMAALSAHAGFLEQGKQGRLAQRLRGNAEKQQLSRKTLRRLNQLRQGGGGGGGRPAKGGGLLVHQPGQRQFNY